MKAQINFEENCGMEFENDEERVLFGTFSILHPQYFSQTFSEFKSIPLSQRLEKLLEDIPIHLSIILCRRHSDLLVYFLRFFNRSIKATKNPKIYLPFICQWINRIPIQWIVNHIQRILDVRYAYLLVASTFSNQTLIAPNSYQQSEELEKLWQKYRELVPTIPDCTAQEAWKKLVDLRTSIIELRDLKLTVPIPLGEYLKYDKKGFMKNFLLSCPNPSKLIASLKTYAIGYCQSNNINKDDLIIETVVRRDWEVRKKLEILKSFLQDQSKFTEALEQMTFQNEQELNEIKEYAKSRKLAFTTNPNNFIQSLMSPMSNKLARSSSNENISADNVHLSSPSKLIKCASLENIDMHSQIYSSSVTTLANGTPLEPSAYAAKLTKYKDMDEIKPIYTLANVYGITVSYENYCDLETKKALFIDILKENGDLVFDKVVQLLNIDKESLVDLVCSTESFQKQVLTIVPHLYKYFTRTNWMLVINFLISCSQHMKTSDICQLWLDTLREAFRYADGIKLVQITNSVAVLKGCLCLQNDEQENIVQMLKDSFNFDDVKEYIRSRNLSHYFSLIIDENSLLSPEQITKALLSDDVEQICLAVQSITLMNSTQNTQILIPLLNEINGKNFSLLMLIYYLLKLNHMNYEKQISILSVLFNSSLEQINFHKLMAKPHDVLLDAVTVDNIYEIISLASLLEVSTDKIILHLMIKKMRSTDFDDYTELISLLREEKSKTVLLDGLAPRFKYDNLIHFYEGLGEKDKVREIKMQQILLAKEFQEQEKDSFKTNPSLMICEYYSSTKLQEKFGKHLHEKMKQLADLHDLSISKIREHLVNQWLSENTAVNPSLTKSVFVEAKEDLELRDDQANVQRALFILRIWPLNTAVKWLLLFIYQNKSYRAKAKAYECLFTLADINTIKSIFKGNIDDLIEKEKVVYLCRDLELAKISFTEDMFRKENIIKTINELWRQIETPGTAIAIFETMYEFQISNAEMAKNVINSLFEFNKHFLLLKIVDFIRKLKLQGNEEIKDQFIRLLSVPFQELINKESYIARFKAHHMSVFLDVLDTFSDSPFPITALYINNELTPLEEVIEILSRQGWANLGAEFGSHVPQKQIRENILTNLLENSHFDLAFQFCFNEDDICSIIHKQNLTEDATRMMVDASFIKYTNWLHLNGHTSVLETVQTTLKKQGRVHEIDRMSARLDNLKGKK